MRKEQTSHKNEHNTLKCFPLEPVFTRDKGGLPNFIDEPTAGLDVGGRISLHDQIGKLNNQGKTIILASHDMAEVEKLCDRIAILHEGRIAFMGTVSELTVKAGGQYDIKITTELGEEHYTSDQIGETMFKLLKNYQTRNLQILDIEINRGKLEQFFMKLTEGE